MSFGVRFGDRLGVIGPFRCGQDRALACPAMLVRSMLGRSAGTAGPSRVKRCRITARYAMYLHQRPALFEGSVEQNLRYPFTLKGTTDARLIESEP